MAKKKTLDKKAQEILDALLKKKCKYCRNLDEMEKEYPDGAYHGADIICDECGAEYYEEYERDILAMNKQASINHPDLQKLYG